MEQFSVSSYNSLISKVLFLFLFYLMTSQEHSIVAFNSFLLHVLVFPMVRTVTQLGTRIPRVWAPPLEILR